ncbi:peptidase S8 [Thalassotalea sp. HSM 43]|uniref:S8 family serine peptidase n=1 Tax=Thalassotalea sp. HSM 43 TaxID=2552945 RepID=UPI001081D704|nr:S8 family serine peptidase [Thalassotalea sp. HSM 43]QBY05279.1 peptidase S8 [Thalassotalea sp. HSM 43]
MIKNKVAMAVFYAAYGLGTATAASDSGATVHAVDIDSQQISQYTKKASNQNTMLQNDGLNVQVFSQLNKFNEEEGITGEHVYIVRLIQQPVTVAAQNQNSNIARAMKASGQQKLFAHGQPALAEVLTYENALKAKQNEVIKDASALLGHIDVRSQFTKAINGFSVKVSQQQAKQISRLDNVANVVRAKNYDLLTDQGPKTISADKIWSGEATTDNMAYKGEGQIVAIIDTGINSDHPSFADVGGDGYDHINPWGPGNYVGDCAVEERAEFISCNDKLIGIRSYEVITGEYKNMGLPMYDDEGNQLIDNWTGMPIYTYRDVPETGEDYQGHGSHTAATAAGNVLIDVDYVLPAPGDENGKSDGTIIKEDLFPTISGVAPHANIVAYQVCYPNNEVGIGGCPGEALVSGIEDAIADGVDVINFSIGGADSDVWSDPVQLAFLSARDAGISVAAAAGNGGQACGEECLGALDNSSPWLAQVAATTHSREIAVETPIDYAGFIDPMLGSSIPPGIDHPVIAGSINETEITGVVVWAKDYISSIGYKDWAGYCANDFPAGTFDFFHDGTPIPGAAEGDTNVIVVCQRNYPTDPNAVARVAKVANVKAGGADGFIMFNADRAQGTPAVSYELPSAHFTYEQWEGKTIWYGHPDNTDGLADWLYSGEMGHQITIKQTMIEQKFDEQRADWLAPFSSRGPSFSNIEILAPTMSAPGVDIYAAYSDEQPFVSAPYGTDYVAISGTSMASPHVAGSMALLRQAHPQWSAAEVQSALSMTADNVVKYKRLNRDSEPTGHAEIYRAGAGRINVAKAVKAGLVMDETTDNFMLANPYNGGTPHKLNLPNMVDFTCAPTCTWIRTVKATKDGTWSVDSEAVKSWHMDMNLQTEENGIEIEVTPKNFTLKKGETQTLVIKASIMESQNVWGGSEVELHSALTLTSDDEDTPMARMPMAFKYDGGDLPANIETVAHRDNASYQLNDIYVPKSDAINTRIYAPTKGDVEIIALPKDDDSLLPWELNNSDTSNRDLRIDEATYVKMMVVPEGAKRLVAESLGTHSSDYLNTFNEGHIRIFVGKDYNMDGVVDPTTETICVSTHWSSDNMCAINDPEPGTYWAIFHNQAADPWADEEVKSAVEEFKISTAVVTGEIATNMSLEAPSSNGKDPIDIEVKWDFEMDKDDIYYTVFDLGTSEVNPGNIDEVGFRLTRGDNDVTLNVSQDRAKTGDMLDLNFSVLANKSGSDRMFTITTQLPEGVDLTAEDFISSSDNVESITVDGTQLIITGTQPNTENQAVAYEVTTNATDEMCMTPTINDNPNPGGYVDLANWGIPKVFSGFDELGGQTNAGWNGVGNTIPTSVLFGGMTDTYSLYGNTEAWNEKVTVIRGNGTLAFDTMPMFFEFYAPLPFNSFPNQIIAPLWRGPNWGLTMDSFNTELSWESGISLAYLNSGWAIVEWDNAADYGYAGSDFITGMTYWDKRDNSIDFQTLLHKDIRHGKGEFEIIMAYDNIDWGTTDGRGSVGLQGFVGPQTSFGPLYGHLGEQYGLDDLQDKLSDDLVVCYNYVGPESSQFTVSTVVDIPHHFSGRTLEFTSVSQIEGMADIEMNHTVTVASNITLVEIADMEVDENQSFTVDVTFIDEHDSANMVSVMGEAIASYEVTMTDTGAQVVITPVENYYGESMVELMVSDIENPHDSASTSFALSVISDGEEPAQKLPEEETEEDDSSGGSLGILSLMLLMLIRFKRQF